MTQFIKTLFQKLSHQIQREIQDNRILSGRTLSELNRNKGIVQNLADVEFKVFSQWGDDGIIQYLIQNLDIPHKTFIEFGVENYTESNTRFLLINNNWSGLIMDGSRKNMDYVRSDSIAWRNDLLIKDTFVTAENIDDLVSSAGFNPEVGLLSVDIDGNDYYVWKNIKSIKPVIVVSEFNSVFGPQNPYCSIYDPAFVRSSHHHSNLLYGASLSSLCDLAEEKGYAFVGCNSAGNNAYFVRKDKLGKIPAKSVAEGYIESKFKESRNSDGSLSFLRGKDRLNSLKGCKVFNTRTQKVETI